jgi:hypothetical protein
MPARPRVKMAFDAIAGRTFAGKPLNRGAKKPTLHPPDLFGAHKDPHSKRAGLKREFTFPPFSVLNAREGDWQARKRAWLALGIESELGRGNDITFNTTTYTKNPDVSGMTGTSIFDPVLCELCYRWFCPPAGKIIDPFAGGSVRGIVASVLGRAYFGNDLSERQVRANREQAKRICDDLLPIWTIGDSSQRLPQKYAPDVMDMVFSCPPYADLEVYSDDPADISNMPYPKFLEVYRTIIKEACALLKPDRFAAWVVGECRDNSKPGGPYYGLIPDTIAAFANAGLAYYNELILVTSAGSLPVRVRQSFNKTRKIGRTHQTILVFVKGDPRKAAEACNGGKEPG